MEKIINWMGGWPNDGFVSASDWEERLAAAADRSRRGPGADTTNPDVSDRLKRMLACGLLNAQTSGEPSHLRLTAGADAALLSLVKRGLQPGDVVLTEPLTSRSALQMFRKAGVRVEPVTGDSGGMDPDALAAAISLQRPKLVYVSPVCSDPHGAVWPVQRFDAVSRICRISGVTLLRDDRQAMLLYDAEKYSENDAKKHAVDGVLSIGQLPPGLVAGLRFGWVAGEPALLERWFSSPFGGDSSHNREVLTLEHQAFLELLQEQPLEPLLDMLRVQCDQRMRRLTDILSQKGVRGLRWRKPAGGVHLWLTLPDGLDGEALLRGAWIRGLMFQPGAPFYAQEPQRNTLRLTFAYADERQMKLGVSRLVEAIGDFTGRFDIG
ncbi:aminotransferase class I/II-fold pyridoxal phosphate-dependent enzyme [Cohnella pontilimi]|nr:PLP-dependent aminotransferase family protein [Cohnella pontilimi]